ncbi:EipB family protein [Enhydrobacter aerosaccus]|nr:DUF1849 family protein [Enhydrobacter aerosaccus]
MRGEAFSIVAAVLLVSQPASAQLQPHRAEYALRLGSAANAPRIGTAVQDIALDCSGWHIKRDLSSEIAFTPSLKVSIASKLDGEEPSDGSAFRYRAVQIENGAHRDTHGTVEHAGNEIRAEIISAVGPEQLVLPPPTLMPVAAIGRLVEQLRAEAAFSPTLMFSAEAMGDVFQIDVRQVGSESLRAAPRWLDPVAVPAAQSWPVLMTFKRAREENPKALFSIRAQLFNTGVLDRLTVDAGIATVTADLQALEMHKVPDCPESR